LAVGEWARLHNRGMVKKMVTGNRGKGCDLGWRRTSGGGTIDGAELKTVGGVKSQKEGGGMEGGRGEGLDRFGAGKKT